jgi:glycerol transport system ATP-binding protein
MAKIVMEQISHRYPGSADNSYAVHPLDIEWSDGGAYALLGPSGCGKTTLLNIISGLLTPTGGRILFGDRDVTSLSPQMRDIAQVFQFPVVYDNMTVEENLSFPLRNRGVPKSEQRERVAEVLELLDLSSLAKLKAKNLGADSKQKISLGRGLVRADANAILFDEPLTVIDPALKWELRAQLKKVHQSVGHTMIYVTHDQTEALTFADQVVVMLEGRVLQIGTPEQLFSRPEHTFVGQFIGSPGMNIMPCVRQDNRAIVGGNQFDLSGQYSISDGNLELGIRPEHVKIVAAGSNAHSAKVIVNHIDDLGREKIVHMLLGDHSIAAILREGEDLPEAPAVIFPSNYLHLYQNSSLVVVRAGGGTR